MPLNRHETLMTALKPALGGVELVIFDLDGTLVDSKLDLALSVNAMRELMGLAPLAHELIVSYVGQGVPVLVRRALGDRATEDMVEKGMAFFLNYYHEHMLDNTVTYPGVREALAELGGKKLAVLTNKPYRFSREMIRRLGLAGLFGFVYGGNSFSQKKPDPVGILRLMADTQVAAQATLMVGDSDIDVLTGRNAGVWTAGVTYGYGTHTLEATPPDLLVKDLRELPALLNGTPKRDSGS